MKRVTGIGGIFFKTQDPTALKAWYERHLGLNLDPSYGTSFEWRQAQDPERKGFTAWSPFPADTDYFAPSQRDFMVNYRVADMDGLLEVLREEGVEVVDEVQTFDYGKFAHILDLEGNKVELWEPFDDAYGKMVEGKTTK
ncbi:MAG: VOC family protein [Planctomycetota bacterium]|nr:VOC family protein [Planctomycetota bacterium]